MTDRLVEIAPKDLPILQSLYKSYGSRHSLGSMAVGNYIGFYEQDPNVKHVKAYCLNGDFTDGTFVITDRNRAYADTLNESFDNLSRLLQLIDYSKGYRFLGVRPEVRPVIRESLQKVNVNIVYDNEATLYHLPKEEALKFIVKPPEDIHLGPLVEPEDIRKASRMWEHQDSSSYPYVTRLVKYNPHAAAFKDDETLVAWILRLPFGILGGLQTEGQYLGRGYGALVTKALSRKIAELGDDVYAAIYLDNIPSHSLFKKLHFEPVGQVFFMSTKITWSLADE